MPATKISCPSCGAGLKLTGPVPAGKEIKCPKCGEPFPVPADELEAASLKPQARTAASPARGAAAARKAPAPKPKPPPEEVDEEATRDGEAEDEPKARKRPAKDAGDRDGEDEDEPRTRKRRAEEEPEPDEERAEDEEEDRPRKARKKRPKQKKKKTKGNPALLWGLVGGGAVLLAAAAVAAVFFLSGPSWKEFRSVEGTFVVDFPGTPKEETENTADGTSHTFSVDYDGDTYGVMFMDMPPVATAVKPEQFLDVMSAGMGPNVKSKTPMQIESANGGIHYPALEVVVEDTDKGKPVTGTARFCLVGRRVYTAMVESPRGKEKPARVKRFMDSFRPWGKTSDNPPPPPGPPMTAPQALPPGTAAPPHS